MNRRAFMRVGAIAGAAIPLAPVVAVSAWGWPTKEPLPTLQSSVRVLGDNPDDRAGGLAKLLSDDVFERLRSSFRRAYPGRALRVSAFDALGFTEPVPTRSGIVPVTLDKVWNTAIELHPDYYHNDTVPPLCLEDFRARTSVWMRGTYMYFPGTQEPATPITEMFDGVRVVGMPALPSGLIWRAHYLDEDTGLVMRALAAYDVYKDVVLCRWDVLCG